MVPSYLNSDFREVDLHGELLAAVHVRVVGLLKGTLQLVQLVGGEGGAVAPVLLLGLLVLARLGRLAFVTLHSLPQFTELLVALVGEKAAICSTQRKNELGVFVNQYLTLENLC